MSNEGSTTALPLDEFERVKAVVSSYRLVDTPAIRAAREYGYDIKLLQTTAAYSAPSRLYLAQPIFAARGTAVRESPSDDRAVPPLQVARPYAPAVQMLQELSSGGVRFVVIGGIAAQLHGSPRVTQDLDIVYDTGPDNLERLAAILLRWRAYLWGVEPGLAFVPDAKTIKGIEVLTLDTVFGRFDVLQRVAGVGTYEDAMRDVRSISLGDFTVHALSLDALIKSKLATGRARDEAEVLELRAIRDIAEQQRAAVERGGGTGGK